MRVLVTAGPTREPIDPVRFLSNESTGRMGFALAAALLARGHEVLLVLGPVHGQPPVGTEVFAVTTAREMHAAVLQFEPDCDAFICAAAVADYRPADAAVQKRKRGTFDTIRLVENPDIAQAIGELRKNRPLAIFALESENGVANAQGKVARKNADLCVLNTPDAIGSEAAEFTFVFADGRVDALGEQSKVALAQRLLDALLP